VTLDDLLREVRCCASSRGGDFVAMSEAERLIRAAYEAGKRDGRPKRQTISQLMKNAVHVCECGMPFGHDGACSP
jgi:hypothetical protein